MHRLLRFICSALFFPFSLLDVLRYSVVFGVIRTQVDGGVVMLTEYTADSGNATSSVCHCGHNRIKAAAITNYRCYPFQNSLQSCTANKK